MISTWLLLLIAAGDPALELNPEALVTHPGLERAEYDGVRAEWMAALEADPASAWAYETLASIEMLDVLCRTPLDPKRLEALIPQLVDADASLRARSLLLREARRRRFSETPHPIAGDLFEDFIRHWNVLGPFGRLDAEAPLFQTPAVDSPVRELRFEYDSPYPTGRSWRPLTRERNEPGVWPSRWVFPDVAETYLLAFVRSAEAEARLQVFTGAAFEAYWNGQLVLQQHRVAAVDTESRFSAPVRMGADWNALVLRFPSGTGDSFGARLLQTDGTRLDYEEANWDGRRTLAWEPTPAAAATESPAPGTPYESILAMRMAVDAGRPDRALAQPAPESAEASAAWLLERRSALWETHHLADEVKRRLTLETEEALERADVRSPIVRAMRIQRLVSEDKPAEAVQEAEALCEEHPDVPFFHFVLAQARTALDPTGFLARPSLLRATERFPEQASFWELLAESSAEADDSAGALRYALRGLQADGTRPALQDEVFTRLSKSAAGRDRAREWLDRWEADEPGQRRISGLRNKLWAQAAEFDRMRQWLQSDVEERPFHPGPLHRLALFEIGRDEHEAAKETLQSAPERRPGDHAILRTLGLLGQPMEADRFFAEFAADTETAYELAAEATDASTALVVDAGFLYLYPDGGVHRRTHAITKALDRKGTETLHEERAHPQTRMARVLDASGAVYEPVMVDGTWVWPALDPGDMVELVYDAHQPGRPGAAPQLGWWRFSSFEQPFVLSRYVVYVPKELPGSWKKFHFAGEHEQIPWGDGTVHVFETRGHPRQQEEVLQPSYEELLPWVEYGADVALEDVAASYARYARYLESYSEDLRSEFEAAVAEVADQEPLERAASLYRLVTDRVLDFSGEGDAIDAWTLRRGRPIGLLAALYRLADIEFDWAVLHPPVSPELNPEPVFGFLSYRRFDLPCLRLANPEGDPVWVITRGGARGVPFGLIPSSMAGATALVLEGDGTFASEELPRTAIEEAWDIDLSVTFQLGADRTAKANGVIRVTDTEGALLRERINQLEPEQRSQAARSIVGNVVRGVDLEEWSFPGLKDRGGYMELAFEGSIPGFIEERNDTFECSLRIPPTRLSTGLGAAERQWPMAVRSSTRSRAEVRLELGDAWVFERGPEAVLEERPGFRFQLDVDQTEQALTVTRVLELRGLWLAPEEVPAFLRTAKSGEDEEGRAVRIRPSGR